MKSFYKIGHRGAMAYEPENTISSIKKAIELGVDAVEIDVYRTKDHELVVMHYEKVRKTTNGKGLVWNLTLPEIKKLDAGNGEKVPTLQEVIDTVKGKCNLLIELKMFEIEFGVIDIVNKNNFSDNTIIISFYHDLIKKVRGIAPMIKTGVTFMAAPISAYQLAINANADYILPHHSFLTNQIVEEAHDHGIHVITWHTEDMREIIELSEMGVDGIMSNRPDLFNEAGSPRL